MPNEVMIGFLNGTKYTIFQYNVRSHLGITLWKFVSWLIVSLESAINIKDKKSYPVQAKGIRKAS